ARREPTRIPGIARVRTGGALRQALRAVPFFQCVHTQCRHRILRPSFDRNVHAKALRMGFRLAVPAHADAYGLRSDPREPRAIVSRRPRRAAVVVGSACPPVQLRLIQVAYGGQIYPGPVGDLKQPTDSGRNCLGSHNTTLGNITVKAMVKRNTTYSGSE